MRILGLDLGTKTLGVAISDNTETISSSLLTIRFDSVDDRNVIPELKKIIDYYNVKLIVLGLPKNMNNTLGDAAKRSELFKKILEENFNIEVILQDERLSSVSANNIMLEADLSRKKRKKKKDEVAASIILQNYLDMRKGK